MVGKILENQSHTNNNIHLFWINSNFGNIKYKIIREEEEEACAQSTPSFSFFSQYQQYIFYITKQKQSIFSSLSLLSYVLLTLPCFLVQVSTFFHCRCIFLFKKPSKFGISLHNPKRLIRSIWVKNSNFLVLNKFCTSSYFWDACKSHDITLHNMTILSFTSFFHFFWHQKLTLSNSVQSFHLSFLGSLFL